MWNLSKKSIQILKGHANSVFCLETVSDEIIISGSAVGKIKIWNMDTSECVSTLQGQDRRNKPEIKTFQMNN